MLPDIDKGQELTLESLEPVQHFTKPVGRFTEASLVKELEKRGIGRPSTYAQFSRLLAQNLPPSSSGLYTVANYKRLRKGPQTFLRDA